MTLADIPIAYCRECGEPFHKTRADKDFDSEACRKIWNQRRMVGGLKLYDLAMRWRIERPEGALSDLTVAADFLAQGERERRRRRQAKIAADMVRRAKAAGIEVIEP